jgi:hypothetical protein
LIGPAGMPAASSLSNSSSRMHCEVIAQSLPTSSALCGLCCPHQSISMRFSIS